MNRLLHRGRLFAIGLVGVALIAGVVRRRADRESPIQNSPPVHGLAPTAAPQFHSIAPGESLAFCRDLEYKMGMAKAWFHDPGVDPVELRRRAWRVGKPKDGGHDWFAALYRIAEAIETARDNCPDSPTDTT